MIHSGVWLARRLEAAEAANDVDCTLAHPGSAVQAFGGGWAIFAGAASPLTRAIGMGLNGPVGEGEVRRLEEFFHSQGASVSIDFCPLASPEFLEILSRRGFRPVEFNNVLVRLLAGFEPYAGDPLVALTGDRDAWARIVGQGFFESLELTEAEMDVGRAIFRSGKAECYLALAQTGEPAAGAALSVRDGTAVLFADSTIPRYRRGGLHAALIRRRLNAALAHGCDLAAATTFPGSASQRNYERLGFQVAYTKVVLVEKDLAADRPPGD
jgi:GNAT superfamily N-acetyltransferase